MMYGDMLNMNKKELNDITNGVGLGFRSKCINEGFYITSLIPVYHQGWELDEWAANATKDGKEYFLTTNHGALVIEEVSKFSLIELIKLLFTKVLGE